MDAWDKAARALKGRCSACPHIAVYGPAPTETASPLPFTFKGKAAGAGALFQAKGTGRAGGGSGVVSPVHCPRHRSEGDVRLVEQKGSYCQHPKCTTMASFGDPSPRVGPNGRLLPPKPQLCRVHKLPLHCDLRNRFCEFDQELGYCAKRAYVRTKEHGVNRWYGP